jgi:hypothetical protein
MSTIQVTPVPTTLGPTGYREANFNGPVEETFYARLKQVGPFRQDNPPASQANTLQQLGAVDATAPTSFVAGAAGTIFGMVAQSNAAITAGAATFRPSLNGVVQGSATLDSVILSSAQQKAVVTLATPISFVAGDLISVMLSTNAGYLPITADHNSYLLIRWAA